MGPNCSTRALLYHTAINRPCLLSSLSVACLLDAAHVSKTCAALLVGMSSLQAISFMVILEALMGNRRLVARNS